MEPEELKDKLDNFYKYAYPIKFIIQMIIGFLILCNLTFEFYFGFIYIHESIEIIGTNIYLKHSLQTVAYGLGISAGIEMAYMLFTPGPDEAVEPVILSLAAAILYGLSVINFENKQDFIAFSVLIGTLVMSIAILFYVRERFIDTERDD